jgi:hypothetical protein
MQSAQQVLNRRIIWVLLGAIMCFLVLRTYLRPRWEMGFKWESYVPGEEERRCLKFLQTTMSSNIGILTNLLDHGEIRDKAAGHQVLSESEGLMMLYAVQAGDKTLFDKHMDLVRNMILDDGVIVWRVGKQGEYITAASAAIDDLRIIRSLLFAYDRWRDDKYKDLAHKLIRKTKKYEYTTHGLVDYYDAGAKMAASTINLSYIDLYTMDLMARIDADWKMAAERGRDVINGGFISDTVPLYRKQYNYETKSYSQEAEINTIDYLKVILHLSEVHSVPEAPIQWIRQQIATYGALFNRYDSGSGKPTTNLECSANYALGCRIAANIGDEDLYEVMKEKLLSFQIIAPGSALDGAFGDLTTKEVFSFDNLQALLALQRSALYRQTIKH